MTPVPEPYLGVWQRRLLTTADGLQDDSSTVFWLQTARLHADLRLPASGVEGGAELALCNAEQLLALAEQQGFAGLTQVEDELCCWHRLMDYQPVSGRADVGLLRFEGSERLLEEGLDGSYHEAWERLPDSRGRNWGQWLRPADDSARQACLLVAGDYFLFAAERPVPLRRGGHLREHIAAVGGERRQALLAFELSFGRLAGGGTPWLITHSSLPGRAGQALLPAACPAEQASDLPDAWLAGLGSYPPVAGWVRAADPGFCPTPRRG